MKLLNHYLLASCHDPPPTCSAVGIFATQQMWSSSFMTSESKRKIICLASGFGTRGLRSWGRQDSEVNASALMQILHRFDRSIFQCPIVSLPSPFSFSLGRARAYCSTHGAKKTMASRAKLAKRLLETDTPVMIQMQELLRSVKDCMSLAQGVVHWSPPYQALEKTKDAIWQPSTSNYGPDEGLPDLREALVEKLRRENKLCKSSVMVTAGANQAFVNLVLALCDPGDSVVMFAPYYFNAYMSFQMTGISNILVGPCDPETLQPDADWLEETLSKEKNKTIPKLVTIVNPGNPSGSYVPDPLLRRISELCKNAGCWLVVDNTYEYFMYDGLKHTCVEAPHIVNVFSFSKAYGMMGWRVGYIAYPSEVEGLAAQLLKTQDNIPICASIIGQKLALYSLELGAEWVKERVEKLTKNRDIILDALSPLGANAVRGGQGAIYLWAKLPSGASNDVEVVQWLAKRHGVMVIPGSASGGPGYLRVSFGGLVEDVCSVAAARLRKGMEELVSKGMLSS